MEIEISNMHKNETTFGVEMSTGKTTAYVFFSSRTGSINVCCANASHRTWGGVGRTFWSIEEAVAGYNSAAMKEIISAAARQWMIAKAVA